MGLKNYWEQKRLINKSNNDIMILKEFADKLDEKCDKIGSNNIWVAGNEKVNIQTALMNAAENAINIANDYNFFYLSATNILDKLNLLDDIKKAGRITAGISASNKYHRKATHLTSNKGDAIFFSNKNYAEEVKKMLDEYISDLDNVKLSTSSLRNQLDKIILSNISGCSISKIQNGIEDLKNYSGQIRDAITQVISAYESAENNVAKGVEAISAGGDAGNAEIGKFKKEFDANKAKRNSVFVIYNEYKLITEIGPLVGCKGESEIRAKLEERHNSVRSTGGGGCSKYTYDKLKNIGIEIETFHDGIDWYEDISTYQTFDPNKNLGIIMTPFPDKSFFEQLPEMEKPIMNIVVSYNWPNSEKIYGRNTGHVVLIDMIDVDGKVYLSENKGPAVTVYNSVDEFLNASYYNGMTINGVIHFQKK